MGDYIKIDGIEVKAGTCEDYRYVRLAEIMDGKVTQANDYNPTPHDVRSARAELLWRFPFPDEDNASAASIDERNMNRSIVVRMPFDLPEDHHGTASVHANDAGIGTGRGGGYGVNMKVPCPSSAEGRKLCSSKTPEGTIARTVGERIVNGYCVTIFECAYCGTRFYLDDHEVDAIRAWYAETYSDNRYENINARFKGAPTKKETAA
jgi:hypothetical protein